MFLLKTFCVFLRMAKEKPTEAAATEPVATDPTDIRYYLHQPHDKYVRALLQHRTAALQIIEFALDETLRNFFDPDSLQLTSNSFIDEKLQISLADICYEGFSKTKTPFRICLLFEHKSEAPQRGLYEQLNRYINNVWLEDQKQDRPPTLSIPILIYHGTNPIEKEIPERLFPHAPPELLRFVPHFDYVLLDVAAMSENAIDGLGTTLLRQILLALKFSRNEDYLSKYWKKVIIFARQFHENDNIQPIIKFTLLYMVSVSKTVQKALENPATNMTVEEEDLVLPYVFQKYIAKYKQEGLEAGRQEGLEEGRQTGMKQGLEQGMKQGLEQGISEGMILLIQKFLLKNPEMSDDAVAEYFEVTPDIVRAARQK
jgi:predicted transposase YdaD